MAEKKGSAEFYRVSVSGIPVKSSAQTRMDSVFSNSEKESSQQKTADGGKVNDK